MFLFGQLGFGTRPGGLLNAEGAFRDKPEIRPEVAWHGGQVLFHKKPLGSYFAFVCWVPGPSRRTLKSKGPSKTSPMFAL